MDSHVAHLFKKNVRESNLERIQAFNKEAGVPVLKKVQELERALSELKAVWDNYCARRKSEVSKDFSSIQSSTTGSFRRLNKALEEELRNVKAFASQ